MAEGYRTIVPAGKWQGLAKVVLHTGCVESLLPLVLHSCCCLQCCGVRIC